MMFNSSLLYELAVLKQYVEPLLFAVDKNSEEYLEAKRLLKFFDYFVGIEVNMCRRIPFCGNSSAEDAFRDPDRSFLHDPWSTPYSGAEDQPV